MLALGAAPGIAIILFIVFRTEDQSMQNLSAAPSIVTSIAVLPFEDVSSEKDQEAFTNAMVIEISDQLVKIDDLQVLSRASTQMYTRSKKSTREIASELESANILMGSVQKEGDNVRITVQLVDGGTDAFLWSEAYDGKLEGIFDMQRTIAHSVAEALKVQIRLLKFGLYKDRCSVGALLNVGKEQIGIEGIDTLEEMAALKQRVINAAREAVILNADDALCAGMIGQYRKLSVILFSMDPHNKILHDHLQNGGTAYVLNREKEEDGIERWEPQSREPFISISELPPAGNGMFPQNIANAMAAAALAEGMGIPLETIKEGLHSFRNSLEQSGGRLHFIEGYSQTILLDFLATVPASIALATSLGRIEVPGRRICMCTTPGDRQHWHYTEIGEALGPHFDHFICFDLEHYRRGRTPARSLNC
jgi:TolB-like protein